VLADADIEAAANTIAYAAMGYAGQKCTATSRVIVEGSVYDEVRDRLVSAVEKMEVVDPERESCQVGPLIEEGARDSAIEAVGRGGGRTLTGGEPLDVEGLYLEPTLVEVEDPESLLAREEVSRRSPPSSRRAPPRRRSGSPTTCATGSSPRSSPTTSRGL
jgi:aldehyde dehydrogenase (NAD+)